MTQEQQTLLAEVEKEVLQQCKDKNVTKLELRQMIRKELEKRLNK